MQVDWQSRCCWSCRRMRGRSGTSSRSWDSRSSRRRTLVGDLEHAAGLPLGPDVESAVVERDVRVAAVALLGDVFGIEGEWTQAPGFFQARDQELVASSSAQTFTGSRDRRDAAPDRRVPRCGRTSSGARASCVCAASTDGRRFRACFRSTRRLPPMDVGGGATGFFNERVGVGWDLRYFRSVGGENRRIRPSPLMGWPSKLSFWRANMALVLRY